MADWPRYVEYRERMAPGAPPIQVELPQTRDDEFDLLATVKRLASEDPVAWKATVRMHTATDWYFMMLMLSGSQRLDPFTGRPEVDCEFQFNYSRQKQFEGDGWVDKTAREHFKSTWEIYVGVTVDVVNNPEVAIALFAFEKAAAEKHGRRVKHEWESNAELKAAWDDVFYWDPERESLLWNMDKGLIVKRTIVSPSPTFSWYSIKELPTGLRIGKGLLDDIETEQTVSTEDARKALKDRVTSAFNLGGRACRWRINGTHHSPAGWIAELESSGAWKVRCHAAEDITKPAPDIAAIYDACGGMLPVREDLGKPIPLPPEVRNVRLAGAPVFLHPLECAHKRLLMGPQRYAEQNMGDALAGQVKRLDEEWIRWYTAPPVEWARGANLYIVVDPSKGVGDPTFARVEACKSDRTISWVGGLRKRLSPSEFGPAIFQLAMEWTGIGTLVEIRVEEFAQSTWSHNLRTYFDSRNHHVCRVVVCSRHNTNNKVSEGRLREWSGLEPLYRMGRRIFPKDGIWVFDELGHRFDLVKFYVDKEYKLFPLPGTDDGLAADYLLAVTKGKNEAGKEIDLELDFPESDEEEMVAARSEGRWNRRNRNFEDEGSWMSGGVF